MNSLPETMQSKSIKQGDVWQLGVHRLICGSAANLNDVATLMNNERISLVLTDPPYGVGYVEGKQQFLKTIHRASKRIEGFSAIKGDELLQDYYAFSKAWLEPMRAHFTPKNAVYIFNGDTKLREMLNAMQDTGYYKSSLLIWVKNHIVVGRKDFHPQHELIVYGWYGTHAYYGNKDKSVLCYPKPNKSKLHPTMKPPALLRRLMYHSSKPGDIVYDPFGGSGSTLIACEQLGRVCRMIELDENYCLTIVQRWEKLTGKVAQKL